MQYTLSGGICSFCGWTDEKRDIKGVHYEPVKICPICHNYMWRVLSIPEIRKEQRASL